MPEREKRPFWVVHGTRAGQRMGCSFSLALLTWDQSGWSERWIDMPASSSHILLLGSGAEEINRWDQRWTSSSQGNTSRAVFAAFCDALSKDADPPRVFGYG